MDESVGIEVSSLGIKICYWVGERQKFLEKVRYLVTYFLFIPGQNGLPSLTTFAHPCIVSDRPCWIDLAFYRKD